jgi:hypothetical protein
MEIMRIATIFLRHGTRKFPDSETAMDQLFRRQMPEVHRDTVVVDTMLPLGHEERTASDRIVLGGDNSFSEFSAADVALSWIGSRIWSYDLVHIATAAAFTLYVRYLERFDTRMLLAIVGQPVCVGHIDCYNEPIRILSYYSQHWIRTSFLFLPPAELKALGSLVSFRDRDRIFSGNAVQPFRPDAPLSEQYRKYIYEWLTGGDVGQNVTWHSGAALTEASLAEFERKTVAILNEHLFAIRLRALGCRVVDTTWLATQLTTPGGGKIRWTLGWRKQLATRDTDPFILKTDPSLSHSDQAQNHIGGQNRPAHILVPERSGAAD